MWYKEAKNIWLEEKVEPWVSGVKKLVGFARAVPNMAYARQKMFLCQDWQFVQRVTTNVGTIFAPLGATLRYNLLLYLLAVRREEATGSL